MSKKIKITEEQLSVIVNYVNENKNSLILTEENILNEGFKEWALAGLMTLASIGGVKAQDPGEITPDYIKAAELVQNKLNSGDLDGDGAKDLKQYFTQAQIDLNQINLSKLMNADTSAGFETLQGKTASTVKAKLNQGFVISGINVTKDTIWKDIPQPVTMDSAISTQFGGNLFTTSSSELSKDITDELDYLVYKLQDMGGEIKSITIESSTDKEPIKMGNEKLAQLRADAVKNYLANLGIDTSKVNVVTKPEQGPDLFSGGMSSEERESAREQTKDYRYVTITVNVEHDVPAPYKEMEISKVIEKIEFDLIRQNPQYGQPVKVKTKTGGTKKKRFTCSVKGSDGKKLDCFKFPGK